MPVQLPDWTFDEDSLVRLREERLNEEWDGYEMVIPWPIKPPKFTSDYQPGSLVALEGRFWEVLAAFRTEDEPQVWRFICQEVPDLDSDRKVPIQADPEFGFDWSAALPKVVWNHVLKNEHAARIFFSCFWRARRPVNEIGEVRIFKNQEMLRGKVLVKSSWLSTTVVVNELPKASSQPALPGS